MKNISIIFLAIWFHILVVAVDSVNAQPSSIPTSQPSRSCSSCAAGQFYDINLASGGSVNTVVGCTSCLPGYTCAGGCSDPQPCPIGKYNGLYSALTCISCSAGSYSTITAAISCTTCPGGYSCASTTAGKGHVHVIGNEFSKAIHFTGFKIVSCTVDIAASMSLVIPSIRLASKSGIIKFNCSNSTQKHDIDIGY